jgi:hypothetical protein
MTTVRRGIGIVSNVSMTAPTIVGTLARAALAG